MAIRPVFFVNQSNESFISEIGVEFTWVAGMALSQKQKSIDNLHIEAQKHGLGSVLEISSKSRNPLGVKLSAFNLKIRVEDNLVSTVESVYQGSKVFKDGGPFTDLYKINSRDSRKDARLFTSGNLIGFKYNNYHWDLVPETSFYDWLYINALVQNEELADQLIRYNAFTDIEYNPSKQINCQARSAAYFVSLSKKNLLRDYLTSKEDFITLYDKKNTESEELKLF